MNYMLRLQKMWGLSFMMMIETRCRDIIHTLIQYTICGTLANTRHANHGKPRDAAKLMAGVRATMTT